MFKVPISAILNDKIYVDYEVFNGTGIWVGIFYCLTGALGFASGSVAAKSKRNKLYAIKLFRTITLAVNTSFSSLLYLF